MEGIVIQYREVSPNEKAMAELRAMAESPTLTWAQDLKHHAMGVAETMAKIHGGHWVISVNHQTCVVLVAQQVDYSM